jgi:uncharacterized protein (TIGR00288 family)
MTTERVMLLIDADNVSVDVMEQAVRLLLNQHGGLHVRRAYCTAESAVANQAAFKRLAIKPMVNLAAGKNSTDIALAVDAIDLVLAERPDVVVIASSDSDFAPLVQRLREKGCVVRGIGQLGKTGDETQDVYDDFTVLEHHKSAATSAEAPARKTRARKTAAAKPAAKAAPAKKAAAKKAPARKAPARKSAATRAAEAADIDLDLDFGPAVSALHQPAPAPRASAPEPVREALSRSARGSGSGRGGLSVDTLLDCLPELAAGQPMALNVAAQRLRGAQLLSKGGSSLKLFGLFGERFELLPKDKPAQVRLRA